MTAIILGFKGVWLLKSKIMEVFDPDWIWFYE